MRLRRDAQKRLDLISFGAANRDDVDTLAQNLGRDGVQLVSEPDALTTVQAVDAWYAEHRFTGRRDRDEAELDELRALRRGFFDPE